MPDNNEVIELTISRAHPRGWVASINSSAQSRLFFWQSWAPTEDEAWQVGFNLAIAWGQRPFYEASLRASMEETKRTIKAAAASRVAPARTEYAYIVACLDTRCDPQDIVASMQSSPQVWSTPQEAEAYACTVSPTLRPMVIQVYKPDTWRWVRGF